MVSVRFGWQLLRFEWKPVAVGLLYTSYKTSLRCLFSLHPDPLDRRVTATHYTIGNRWWKELLKPLRCSSRILMCAKFKPTKMSRKQKDKQTAMWGSEISKNHVTHWAKCGKIFGINLKLGLSCSITWLVKCAARFFFFCNQSQGILGYPSQHYPQHSPQPCYRVIDESVN